MAAGSRAMGPMASGAVSYLGVPMRAESSIASFRLYLDSRPKMACVASVRITSTFTKGR
jgi:hypothetical protein